MSAMSASDQEVVNTLLLSLTGTIGEFQLPHFVIAQDEKEIKLMSCYRFLDNRAGSYFSECKTPSYEIKEGTFYMVRQRINIPAVLESLNSSISSWQKEQDAALGPRREKIQTLEQKAAAEDAETGRRNFLSSLFRGSPDDNVRKLRSEAAAEKIKMSQEDRWQDSISLFQNKVLFYQHLAQRYGQDTLTVLEHAGIHTFNPYDHPVHDHRGASTYFTLFGKDTVTKILFDLASRRVKGDFIRLIWGLCQQTPYMGFPVGEELRSHGIGHYNKNGYRDESYQLFDRVHRLQLYDAIERKKVFLSQR